MTAEEIGLEDTEKFLVNDTTDPSQTKFSSDEKRVVFSGLSKDEIKKYGDDPQWVRIRWFLFILFWVVWVLMLTSAVLIVIFSPKCAHRPDQAWWQKEVVYQLDVATFYDKNSDSIGDLAGLKDKLDYFENIGIKTLCLKGNILDTNDPTKVLPVYGDETILKDLKKSADSKDLHLILDIPMSLLDKNDDAILTYWLSKYVDGVRITELKQEEINDEKLKKFNEWLELARKIQEKTVRPKFIAYYPSVLALNKTSINIDQSLLNIKASSLEKPSEFYSLVKNINSTDRFILNDYNSMRIKDSLNNPALLPIYHGLTLLLKGTPFLMYGDELEFDRNDKYMKWDQSNACGFTKNTTIKNNNCKRNVKEAFAHGSDDILIDLYKDLNKLRQKESFSFGNILINEVDDNLISFVRLANGFDGFLVAANTGSNSHLIDFKEKHNLPIDDAVVEYFYTAKHENKDFTYNSTVSMDNIKLKSGQFLVLRFTQ